MKTPSFWYDTQSSSSRMRAAALEAASAIYGLGHLIHQNMASPVNAGIPILCIGNLVAGGGGKTPTALAIMEMIQKENLFSNPCFLSRGYGGTLCGPVMVDPLKHTAKEVGDEPLLLSNIAPTIICANRAAGALFAKEHKHDFIIMDDGLQNTSLHKNLSIVVIDGASGFGNEKLLPSGPLRTPIALGLGKADSVLMIGEDRHNVLRYAPDEIPILRADIVTAASLDPHPSYIAFCGIAHPGKFQATLLGMALKVVEFHDFPDHYSYSETDLTALQNRAVALNARLVTTAKDAARLSPAFIKTAQIAILPVKMQWIDHSDRILMNLIKSEKKT